MTLMLSQTSSLSVPVISALHPKRTNRCAIIGQTGSGKTVLARVLLWSRKFVVVHDGKGTIDWATRWPNHYKLFTSLNDLVRMKPNQYQRVIYRPRPEELLDLAATNRFFRWVFQRRYCTLYVDETYSIMQTGISPFWYIACVTRGREVNVETWSGMQRPTMVPLVSLTESEHCYCFYLQWEDDRKRVEQTFGIEADAIANLPFHYFYYSQTQSKDVIGPLTLDLDEPIVRKEDDQSEMMPSGARI